MSFLTSIAFNVIVFGIIFGIWVKYEMNKCHEFTVDYSQAPGKNFLITGANSGLGFETSRLLAKHGGNVIMACRSLSRCQSAKELILQEQPQAKIEVFTLNLSSFQSIHSFITQISDKIPEGIDVLINNAGIMAIPTRELTEDGLEMQIGTNHFGHFLLTALLYPHLRVNSRIINHSSIGHMYSVQNFVSTDVLSQSYDPWLAYGNSKLSNLYFTYELNDRLESINNPKNIQVIAVHPGYTATNLQNGQPFHDIANEYLAMTLEDGVKSQVYAAVDPKAQASRGTYFGPKWLFFGEPIISKTSSQAQNKEEQIGLWEISQKLTGQKFIL